MGQRIGKEQIVREAGYLYVLAPDGYFWKVPTPQNAGGKKARVGLEKYTRKRGVLYYLDQDGYVCIEDRALAKGKGRDAPAGTGSPLPSPQPLAAVQVPQDGALPDPESAQKSDYAARDRRFRRGLKMSGSVLLAAGAVLLGLSFLLGHNGTILVAALAPVGIVALVMGGSLVAVSIFVRRLVWEAGSYYGP